MEAADGQTDVLGNQFPTTQNTGQTDGGWVTLTSRHTRSIMDTQ